jgi:hypothetical protein
MVTRSAPTICVGIDPAGVAHRETGLALLRDGHLERLETGGDDAEILHLSQEGRHRVAHVRPAS